MLVQETLGGEAPAKKLHPLLYACCKREEDYKELERLLTVEGQEILSATPDNGMSILDPREVAYIFNLPYAQYLMSSAQKLKGFQDKDCDSQYWLGVGDLETIKCYLVMFHLTKMLS